MKITIDAVLLRGGWSLRTVIFCGCEFREQSLKTNFKVVYNVYDRENATAIGSPAPAPSNGVRPGKLSQSRIAYFCYLANIFDGHVHVRIRSVIPGVSHFSQTPCCLLCPCLFEIGLKHVALLEHIIMIVV